LSGFAVTNHFFIRKTQESQKKSLSAGGGPLLKDTISVVLTLDSQNLASGKGKIVAIKKIETPKEKKKKTQQIRREL
jgi:hypothetical protein